MAMRRDQTFQGDKVSFVTVLDPHLSPVTPASRKDDFLAATIDAFNQTIDFAVRSEAKAILVAGDVFHLKSSSRNPHWFMIKVISLLRRARDLGVPIVGIAGNHDLTFGSIVSVNTQPIGVLVESGVYHLLDDNPIDWVGEQFSVRVAGCSFEHAQADPVRKLKKGSATFLVALGHFWYGPVSGNFFGEPVYGPDFLGTETEVDAYVIGHHHEDQGIPKIGNQTYFVHGSMNRVGAHKGDLERRPAVGLMTVTKDGIEGKIARIKTPPIEEIFDLEKRAQIVKEREELDRLMSAMSESQVVPETDMKKLLEQLAPSMEVRRRAEAYLEEAERD